MSENFDRHSLPGKPCLDPHLIQDEIAKTAYRMGKDAGLAAGIHVAELRARIAKLEEAIHALIDANTSRKVMDRCEAEKLAREALRG